ncbi:hypothetical protein ABPG75_004027 [Micractinium tetrahymenae]
MEAQQPRLELPAACCWTGRVAAWAPFPSQQQQAGGGLPPLKTAARGVWLRSEQGGVLMVRCGGASTPPLLTFTLRSSQQLVRASLSPGGFSFRLLCPTHGAPPPTSGGSSGHLLFLSLGADGSSSLAGPQAGGVFAVHFDTTQGGLECGALLQAIQHGSLGLVAPPAVPAAVATAAAAAAPPAAGPVGGRAAVAPQAGGLAETAVEQAGAEARLGDASLFGCADEASLAEAIQAARADPAFEALVGMWEQAVARVEALLP